MGTQLNRLHLTGRTSEFVFPKFSAPGRISEEIIFRRREILELISVNRLCQTELLRVVAKTNQPRLKVRHQNGCVGHRQFSPPVERFRRERFGGLQRSASRKRLLRRDFSMLRFWNSYLTSPQSHLVGVL